MRKFLITLTLAAALLFTLSSCGSDTAKTEKPAAAKKEETPAKNNADREMVVALPSLPSTADSMNHSTIYARTGLNMQTYDTLIAKDGDGNYIPNMAESYKMSDDATECAVTLRKGIKWWDGTEVKASDVKYTVERAKVSSGVQTTALADVDHVEVSDDYTFKFVLKNANVALIEYLTYVFILQEKFTTAAGKDYGTAPDKVMGSGPYKLVEWVPGDYLRFEAFEDYWNGAPNIKKIRLKVITDVNAAVIALQTGELHLYLGDIPFNSTQAIESSPKLTLEYANSNRFNYVVFNTENELFSDVRVRQAVAKGINREEMLIVALEDAKNGTIVDSPGGPDFAGFPGTGFWPWSYNPEEAAKEIEELGKKGQSVTIATLNFEPYIKVATKLQADLSKIGLTADIRQMENSAFADAVCGRGDYVLAVSFNNYGGKDCDISFSNSLSSKYGMSGNYARYKDEKLDALILAAKSVVDPEARKAAYLEAGKYWDSVVVNVPLFVGKSTRAYSKELTIDKGLSQYDKYYHFKWAD